MIDSKANCYAKQTTNGILVSTKRSIPLHKHGVKRIFAATSGTINGVELLFNHPNISTSINCRGFLHTTDYKMHESVELNTNDNFNWSLTKSITNHALERQIMDTSDELHDRIDHIKASSNNFLSLPTLQVMPNQRGPKIFTSILLSLSIFFLLTTVAFITYILKCRRAPTPRTLIDLRSPFLPNP